MNTMTLAAIIPHVTIGVVVRPVLSSPIGSSISGLWRTVQSQVLVTHQLHLQTQRGSSNRLSAAPLQFAPEHFKVVAISLDDGVEGLVAFQYLNQVSVGEWYPDLSVGCQHHFLLAAAELEFDPAVVGENQRSVGQRVRADR